MSGSDRRRNAPAGGAQVLVRDHHRDQPDPVGVLRVDHGSGEAEVLRHGNADRTGQKGRHTLSREDAHSGMGVRESCGRRGHQEVARQGQFEASRHRGSVDGSDDRLRHQAQREPGIDLGTRGGSHEPARVSAELDEVQTGTEGRVGSGDNDGLDGRVGCHPPEGGSQLAKRQPVQRVASGRPV